MTHVTAPPRGAGALLFAGNVIFHLFEKALDPTAQPARLDPPAGLVPFYWHFARQAKGLFAALFAMGLLVAMLDSMIPVFMGRVVSLVTSSDPTRLWNEWWRTLLGMAAVLLIVRPLGPTGQDLLAHPAIPAH